MGPSSDGAELPWVGIAAEAKQAAGFGVLSITCCPRDPAAENMSCNPGLLHSRLVRCWRQREEKPGLVRVRHIGDRRAGT